jgi:hypothetical protein
MLDVASSVASPSPQSQQPNNALVWRGSSFRRVIGPATPHGPPIADAALEITDAGVVTADSREAASHGQAPLRASALCPSLAAEWRDNDIPSHGNVRRIDEARVRLRRVLKLTEHDRHQSENADPSPDDSALTTHVHGLLSCTNQNVGLHPRNR